MKTPREVILERHQSAEAKLKGMRAADLAACVRSTAEESGERQPQFSLAVIARRFWAEAFWPWRRVWAGVAAGWLVILALILATSDTPRTASTRPPRPNPEVLAVLQQQEQLLTQLLGTETPPVSHPRVPGPRSTAQPPDSTRQEAGRLETTPPADILAEA